jgi:hypothetical protein
MSQVVSADEVGSWERDGFLVKERFADSETLELLRSAYAETLDARADGDRMLGGVIRQVVAPSQTHPAFDDNALIDQGLEVMRELFDTTDAVRVFDMLLYKPAGLPHETPWHQDQSYAAVPFAPPGTDPVRGFVHFWVPLDDVGEDNGCMQFVPGHHTQPLLPHRVAAGDPNDPGRLLEIDDAERHLDLSQRVVAALPAGGVTMHTSCTPHYTGPNSTTDRPRRAYAFTLATTMASRPAGTASW